jgi:pilus assembly protein CpaF
VGEVRGDEALDLVAAMNTGHGGSMGTTHANTPFDALVRLETLAMSGGTKIPEQAIRRQIISAIHVVVQIKRLDDGSRKVTHISEVHPELDGSGKYIVHDIYRFVQRGKTPEGKIIGELIPTGRLPSFMEEIEVNRMPFPKEKFTPPEWYLELQKKRMKDAA